MAPTREEDELRNKEETEKIRKDYLEGLQRQLRLEQTLTAEMRARNKVCPRKFSDNFTYSTTGKAVKFQ